MRVIQISFTGKADGKVFDTTDPAKAEEAGIKKEHGIYAPLTITLGKGEIIKGLEEALQEMKEGEEKTITIGPEKAFGERKKELIGLISKKEFEKRKMQPTPGMIIEVNNSYGRVQSVSGGRVRIDFNNELAGKTVEYQVKIEKELKEPKEVAKALAEKYFPNELPELKQENGQMLVELKGKNLKQNNLDIIKNAFNKEVFQALEKINKIKYSEEYARE